MVETASLHFNKNITDCSSSLQPAASEIPLLCSSPSPLHADNKTLYIPISVPKFIFNNSSKLTCGEGTGVTKCGVTKYYTWADKGSSRAGLQPTITKCCSGGKRRDAAKQTAKKNRKATPFTRQGCLMFLMVQWEFVRRARPPLSILPFP